MRGGFVGVVGVLKTRQFICIAEKGRRRGLITSMKGFWNYDMRRHFQL
jgi:hypothetical protein